MSLSTQVAKNTIIQFASKIISTILGLVAVAIMTRSLGQEGFGEYTTIITFLSFFAVIADLGLTLVTVQMISHPQSDQHKILSNLFGLRLISAFVCLGLAPLIIIFFPYPGIIKLGVAVTSLSFFFIALNQILIGLFQKHLKMIIVSSAEVVGRAALLVGIIVSVYLKGGLVGIMAATVISSIINFLINYAYSRGLVKFKIGFDWPVWREIIEKSWPLAVTIVFNLIYLRADTLILSLFKSQSEVGLYGAAYKVVDVLTALPFMFAGLVLPILTSSWAEKNMEKFSRVIQRSFDVLAIIAIPMVAGTLMLAQPIMTIVAGTDFAVSGNILKILILATAAIFLGCIFSHAIIAVNKQRKVIFAYVFTAITSLLGYLIFIPLYSYYGAAWVTLYSELIIALFSLFLVWKYAKFLPNPAVFGKSIFAAAVMAFMIFLLKPWLNLIILIFIGAAIYFVVLYLAKGIAKNELLDLIKK